MMHNALLAPDLRLLLETGEQDVLRVFLEEHEPPAAAELIEDFGQSKVRQVLDLLEPRDRAQVFSYLEHETQEKLIGEMTPEEAAELIHLMPHDDRADLVNRLDEDDAERVMRKLAHAEREDIKRLASYEDGTAGAVMTTDYAVVPAHLAVREALELLRKEAPDRETIDPSYVIDHHRKLLGVLSLKTLVLARPAIPVEEIMSQVMTTALVEEDQEEVARKIAKYDLLAIPVIDNEGKLLGIVTHDDALDILRRESTEDMLSFGGVRADAESDESEYWQGRIISAVWRRVPWLLLLFFSGVLTGWAQERFLTFGAELCAMLGIFAPLLIGTGGNAGSQTVGTIIRGLTLREIHPSDAWRVLGRELLTGLILGAFLSVLGLIFVYWLKGKTFGVALAVSISILGICMWANSIGALVPLLAKKFGLDPALISAPLISTVVDVSGLMIYFGISFYLLFYLSFEWHDPSISMSPPAALSAPVP